MNLCRLFWIKKMEDLRMARSRKFRDGEAIGEFVGAAPRASIEAEVRRRLRVQ